MPIPRTRSASQPATGYRTSSHDPKVSDSLALARQNARDRIDRGFERAKERAYGYVDEAQDPSELEGFVEATLDATGTLPLPPSNGNALADRIGPVWTLKGAALRMSGHGAKPLGSERLRQRATERTLVGLFTRDRKWVLPAWQFRTVDGRLTVRDDVVKLWRELPHDPQRASDWTMAAWMASPLASLGRHTPLEWLGLHGMDAALAGAAARVRARTAA